MSTHTIHTEIIQPYFCTITCHRWLPLIDQADAYAAVYNWFDHLRKDDCLLLGYMIMPNHLHVLLFPQNDERSLNQIVSEGKRFMAYDIVKRLKAQGSQDVLESLQEGVQQAERLKGKKHQVWRLSFDAKLCFSEEMLEQKLDYIHHNPVSSKWSLSEDYVDYPYSSAGYYQLDKDNAYLTHYKNIKINTNRLPPQSLLQGTLKHER